MNKSLMLISLVSIFSLSFYSRENLGNTSSADITVASTIGTQDNPKLIIMFVKNEAGTELGSNVIIKKNGSRLSYPQVSGFDIQKDDILEFTSDDREPVIIKINQKLHLEKIGIYMFNRKPSQKFESVEGTAIDKTGSLSVGLNMSVSTSLCTSSGKTNAEGIYKFAHYSGNPFTITFFYPTSTAVTRSEITVTTNNDGGRTVIDVAFDDDGKKDK